ncbi:hypothetical protein SAMN04487995_0256 [Dyadobacter koreensis]|uniref:Uncharacterized protein n=1 Tax=Dyadobacter koreensis TaxID=408657 RepID=A0A1H6QHL8_9BACT|nr:hypothetical protein [Dyadobacter koreensis]SEI38492.1 hypothetical protein SAMN04487995_0256 [Dyadobacter koreensis]
MLSFYFILLGTYLYYAKSKYFPAELFRPSFTASKWFGSIFFVIGSAIFIYSDGWAGGFLMTMAGASLAMAMIQFFAVMGKRYFYGLIAMVQFLALIELIYYAC